MTYQNRIFMNKNLLTVVFVFLTVLTTHTPAQATTVVVNPKLKDATAQIPIAGIKAAVKQLYDSLQPIPNSNMLEAKKTFPMSGLGNVPLQLYVFGASARQTALLVVNRTITLPQVIPKGLQKRLAGTTLTDPIFSMSTIDNTLTRSKMPDDLKRIVQNSYFNVGTLEFPSGIQLMGKASIKGLVGKAIKAGMGVPVQNFILRVGVTLPIPADARSGAGFLLAMPKSPKDVPEGQIEFQLAPGKTIKPKFSNKTLSDATISFNTSYVLGYKGNVITAGGKKIVTFFETPINPAGALDMLEFQLGLAAPTITLEDIAIMSMSRMTSTVPGQRYMLKGVDKYMSSLKLALKPLSVFQIRNPMGVPDYRFGDSNHPFPPLSAFNILALGPLASVDDTKGPLLKVFGKARVLGQQVGSMDVYMDEKGLHGIASAGLSLKLGPLKRQSISMTATAEITDKTQTIGMHGAGFGRVLDASMDSTHLSISSPATCATPFSLSQKIAIQTNLNLSTLLNSLPGVNVDPAQIAGCYGEDLQKALKWITTTGRSLGGYSARSAQAAIDKAYNDAKNAARDVANKSSKAANKALKSAGNAFRGKRHRHHNKPNPRFASSVFDWDYYYDHNPDLVKAGVDLATHWNDHGFNEGRRGSLEFSVPYYRNHYLDIPPSCSNQCALDHWLNQGINQGRQGSPDFSVKAYILRYPDLGQNLGEDNYPAALDHWINGGNKNEHRIGRPDSTSSKAVAGPQVAGGGGGSHWTELNTCKGQYVNGFRLFRGGSIDMIQFRYVNSGWAPQHGYQNPNRRFDNETILPAGEYFVRVEYASAGRVDKLKFTTNRGHVFGPYGGGNINGTYNVTPGEKLGCMSGRAGSSIDQLIFTSTGPY